MRHLQTSSTANPPVLGDLSAWNGTKCNTLVMSSGVTNGRDRLISRHLQAVRSGATLRRD